MTKVRGQHHESDQTTDRMMMSNRTTKVEMVEAAYPALASHVATLKLAAAEVVLLAAAGPSAAWGSCGTATAATSAAAGAAQESRPVKYIKVARY